MAGEISVAATGRAHRPFSRATGLDRYPGRNQRKDRRKLSNRRQGGIVCLWRIESGVTEERQVVCSRCLQVVAESRIHVIPAFNRDCGAYVTAYHCEQCWLPALEEAGVRLQSSQDADEIASAAMFFERHGIFLHELQRGDPLPVVRKLLGRMFDLLRSEAICPPIPIGDGFVDVLPLGRSGHVCGLLMRHT